MSIGTFAITPEGPGERSEYLLMDCELCSTPHTPDEKTDALLEELNAKMRPATSCHFKFTSNRDYFRGLRIPDDPTSGPIANTIFSTDGYLTWNQYIKVDPDEWHETLLRLSGGVSDDSACRDDNDRNRDRRLAANPFTAGCLGAISRIPCWLSHTGRHPEQASPIVQKLDDSFQQLMSEHFTHALLESFRVCLSDALNQRDDPTAYYARLAEAFGYLFWSNEVQLL